MKLRLIFALAAALLVSIVSRPRSASAQELFGVYVVIAPQSNSPVRIKEIRIGYGHTAGSPQMIVENTSRKRVTDVEFDFWYGAPYGCFDEARFGSPEMFARKEARGSGPIRPHHTGEASFFPADWPLRTLGRAATLPVGYLHVQVSVSAVSFADGSHWQGERQFDHDLYALDKPVCGQWKAIMPFLEDIDRSELLLKDPDEIQETGARLIESSDTGYFYTCARVQTLDRPIFVCPDLSDGRSLALRSSHP